MSIVPGQREIVDRRAVAAALEAADAKAAPALLKAALAGGRAEIARRLAERPYAGTEAAAAYAFLTDQILRLAYDFVTQRLHPLANPTTSERLLLMAVGGYGRGEMALHSDVDIVFVTPWKPTAWTETVIEAILYLLWDLGLNVGHAARSADEVIRLAAADQTVRTATLEARYIWGDESLYDDVMARFWTDVVAGNVGGFVKEKLDERDARHHRMGDSRYVVEPNIKEGKGGLRDLHALFWIGKYAYRLRVVAELVEVGLFSPAELRQFQRAERFLWAVRCQLHLAAGRAEERLTFDYQREIAARMNYADRPGKSPVERFMRHYFLTAKTVGDLTGVFLAHLDEKFARRGRRIGLPAFGAGRAGSRASCSIAAGSRCLTRPFSPPSRCGSSDVRARRPLRARNPPVGDARGGEPGEADRRRRPRRSPRQRALPRCADQSTRSRDGAEVDERGRGVRPFHSRFRPGRRPDCSSTCTTITPSTSIRSAPSACSRGSSKANCARSTGSRPPCSS